MDFQSPQELYAAGKLDDLLGLIKDSAGDQLFHGPVSIEYNTVHRYTVIYDARCAVRVYDDYQINVLIDGNTRALQNPLELYLAIAEIAQAS